MNSEIWLFWRVFSEFSVFGTCVSLILNPHFSAAAGVALVAVDDSRALNVDTLRLLSLHSRRSF